MILTSHALRNYSKVSRGRDPTSLSLLFIACSNRHQTESTPQLLGLTKPRPPRQSSSRLFEIARVLVRFDYIASFIANANHSIV